MTIRILCVMLFGHMSCELLFTGGTPVSAEQRTLGSVSHPVTFPVVDSLIALKLNDSLSAEEVELLLSDILILDLSTGIRAYGDGFWSVSVASGHSYADARDSCKQDSNITFINPVLAWGDNKMFYLKNILTLFLREPVGPQADSLFDNLGLVATYADSVSGRLFRLEKLGHDCGDITAIVDELNTSSLVEFVTPASVATGCLMLLPNDPLFVTQSSLRDTIGDHDIDADSAWEITQGSPDVAIALIESGIELSHPDLAGLKIYNPTDIGGVDRLRTDDNDKTVANMCSDERSGCVHGTQVLGVISAQLNNATGIAGIAPKCAIMPVKMYADNDFDNEVNSDDWLSTVRAILHATRMHKLGDSNFRTLVFPRYDGHRNKGILLPFGGVSCREVASNSLASLNSKQSNAS